MSVGLVALLDDVAAIAKVAAASIDDVAAHAAKAGAKSAGLVIDDTAVTPRYVVGFAADRELPIVWRIAVGSLKNKLLILLPAAMLLSVFAPFLITPLLVLGGLYLCYEGAEKLYEVLVPHEAHAHEEKIGARVEDPEAQEDTRVAGAIRTDFILSAEIMAIALSTVPDAGFVAQAATLAIVGIVITAGVYGLVALIVKADDAGVALAGHSLGAVRMLGRAVVLFMPFFLSALAAVGTAAMLWVGGGIVLHGLEEFGVTTPAHLVHVLTEVAAPAGSIVAWLAGALGAGIFGIAAGALMIPLVSRALVPLFTRLRTLRD